jgi:hypothetical protein
MPLKKAYLKDGMFHLEIPLQDKTLSSTGKQYNVGQASELTDIILDGKAVRVSCTLGIKNDAYNPNANQDLQALQAQVAQLAQTLAAKK